MIFGSKKSLSKIAVLLLLVQATHASDTEGERAEKSQGRMTQGQMAQNQQYSQQRSQQQQPRQYVPINHQHPIVNGPTLPVMGSNAHSFDLHLRPRGTDSSATTPFFPSAYGFRPQGLGTHADYVEGLNNHVAATQQSIPAVQRARLDSLKWIEALKRSQVALKTEAIDQGPLGPAPRSTFEYAGWLEYLALLFGDAENAQALRQILSRLTRLAQTELGEAEAQKAQAATAFLAAHFEPLLKASYSHYIFDNQFAAHEASWSQDSNFAGVFELLVDKMDIFGAQKHFSQVFGDNAQYALSLGNRQPEWLQLKLVLELIAWDVRHQNDLLSLWSSDWKLTTLQKLSILAYATNPSLSAPLDPNMPHREQVLARVNLITNGIFPKDQKIIATESPLDQAHYKFAQLQLSGALCKNTKSNLQQQQQSSQQQQQTTEPVTSEASAFKQRVDDYCELTNLTPTFTQFCQTDSLHDATPIAALLSASKPLFKQKLIAYLAHLERLYWSFLWIGACREAGDVWKTLVEQLKVLQPRETLLRQGKRVPSDVADSVHQRLQYMQVVLQRCSPNVAVTNSPDAARILSLLQFQHEVDALFSWEHVYSQVAARLEGYPQGPSLIVSGESELLFAQARDVRLAILLYKYPKAVYAPCLGRGLLTGDPNTDLTLLNLAHSIDTSKQLKGHQQHFSTSVPEVNRRSLYMRAHFIAGDYRVAAQVAREIYGSNKADELAQAVIACTQLCGTDTRNPCEASSVFSALLSLTTSQPGESQQPQQSQPGESQQSQQPQQQQPQQQKDALKSAYSTGKELSDRLCRLNRNTAADALSLRYGKVLTTQPIFSALQRIMTEPKGRSRLTSKLLPGGAESVLPWFGVLPPAPVEDILSFSPVNSGKFVAGVGIRGMPVIKLSTGAQAGEESEADSSTPQPSGSNKIFVLGKQYDANYLKEGERGNLQPKIEVKKGIYQFSTPKSTSSQNSAPASQSAQGTADSDEES